MSFPDATAPAVERLKAQVRLALAASVGVALLLAPPRGTPVFPLLGVIVGVYLLFAASAVFFYRRLAEPVAAGWRLAVLVGDVAVLGTMLLIAPRYPAPFLLFFLYFALVAGLWRGWRGAAGLAVAVSAAYAALVGLESHGMQEGGALAGLSPEIWMVAGGLVAAGALVGALAQWERRRLEWDAVVEHCAHLLSLDRRWPELWRGWMDEMTRRFRAQRALLACHDPETDRVALWHYRRGREGGSLEESDEPPRAIRTFLLDAEPLSLAASRLDRRGGAEWHVRRAWSEMDLDASVSLPARFREQMTPRSLLSAPLAAQGAWRARLFLLDGDAGFTAVQLGELQRLLARLEPVLANLLTVRSLVEQKVNEDRDRISRELHDSLAQTLASLEMQLNLYQRLACEDPEHTATELGRLKDVVKQEQEALRRFLRTLKLVRIPATELSRRVLALCAQFQQETGIAVDVEAEPVDVTLPEGLCREVFLILREALHNVRKHAGARHVLVRLRQDDAFLRLLVDDDGAGFPFSGTYAQPALEEKGLLPVSIGEHTRALQGTLTIDSTPGSGSTVRVDIPLQ